MDNYKIYSIGFTTNNYGNGVAIAVGPDVNQAFNALKTMGRLNATPQEYHLHNSYQVGWSNLTSSTLVSEEYTDIKLIIGPEGPKGDRGPKGDKGDTGNVNYATFEIVMNSTSPNYGYLLEYYSDSYSGGNFSINNGYLEFTL